MYLIVGLTTVVATVVVRWQHVKDNSKLGSASPELNYHDQQVLEGLARTKYPQLQQAPATTTNTRAVLYVFLVSQNTLPLCVAATVYAAPRERTGSHQDFPGCVCPCFLSAAEGSLAVQPAASWCPIKVMLGPNLAFIE